MFLGIRVYCDLWGIQQGINHHFLATLNRKIVSNFNLAMTPCISKDQKQDGMTAFNRISNLRFDFRVGCANDPNNYVKVQIMYRTVQFSLVIIENSPQ